MMAHERDRLDARLALEGNPIFTDLRMERDTLREQNAALLEALEQLVKVNTRIQEPAAFENVGDWIVVSRVAFDRARAAIAKAKEPTQ